MQVTGTTTDTGSRAKPAEVPQAPSAEPGSRDHARLRRAADILDGAAGDAQELLAVAAATRTDGVPTDAREAINDILNGVRDARSGVAQLAPTVANAAARALARVEGRAEADHAEYGRLLDGDDPRGWIAITRVLLPRVDQYADELRGVARDIRSANPRDARRPAGR